MKFLVHSLTEMKIPCCVPKGNQIYKGLRKKRSYLGFLIEKQNGAEIALLTVWSQ